MSERNTLRTRQDFCPERRSEGISRARSQSVWAGPSERQALARTAVCQKVPWLGVEGPGGWRTVAVPRQAVGREARRGPQRTVEGRGLLWQSGTCLRGSGLGVHVTLKSAWVCVRPRSGQARTWDASFPSAPRSLCSGSRALGSGQSCSDVGACHLGRASLSFLPGVLFFRCRPHDIFNPHSHNT